MKYNQITIHLFLAFLIFMVSCSKEEDKTPVLNELEDPIEDPIIVLPETSFTVSDSVISPSQMIQFFASAEEEPISWKWIFGDNSHAFEQNPFKKYYETGEYTVQLIVEFPNGTDTLQKSQYITVIENPIADFEVDKRIVESGIEIQFQDKSLNGIVGWEWDFGDGTSSDLQNPVKTYDSNGEYTVSLSVVNEYGWKEELVKEDYITIGPMEFVDVRDGQVYGMVQIGNQIWMDRNFNYPDEYAYYYDNNDSYSDFGLLYPEYISNSLIPDGWHIPTMEEWEELFTYVGGQSIAGGKLKEDNSQYWSGSNVGATNEYGFSARGAGYYDFGEYSNITEEAVFHTSSGYYDEWVQEYVSIGIILKNNSTGVYLYDYLADYYDSKLSLRLIKD